MANPTIIIYTTATCAYCHAEKEFLKQHGIAYEEKQADVDIEAAHEMVDRSGQMGVPFTVITGADGKVIDEIVGFDQPRIAKAVGV